MYSKLETYCNTLSKQFNEITSERKILLERISSYIKDKMERGESVQLIYICTHNSRRSHFGQIWATVAGKFYRIQNVLAYSGGTEATAFHPNAIAALKRAGFVIRKKEEVINPLYEVDYSDGQHTVCFSKEYNHKNNPQSNFAAIMTCSEAEENCPFIPGAELRIATTYNDPKAFDNSPQQDIQYDQRCRQIALETLYVFSTLKK